jgi:molecular chaperone GrpE
VEEERAELARMTNAALVINVLPVFDDLERAISTVDAHLAGLNWVQGVDAIYRKFGRLLESMGVKPIEAEGKRFDPSEHEAVGRQPGDEGKVLHVVQQGYRLGDRVIRPAMVIVGNGESAGASH